MRPLGIYWINGMTAAFARACAFLTPVLGGRNWNMLGYRSRGGQVPRWCANHQLVHGYTHCDKLEFDQTAWRFYRRLRRSVLKGPILFGAAGLELDYSQLLLKPLAEELHVPASILKMARKLGLRKPVYLGRLLWDRWPLGAGGVFGKAHRFCVWLSELREAALLFGLQFTRIAIALGSRRVGFPGINAIYFGAGTPEFGRLGEKRSFYWPERIDCGLKFLYVLPRRPPQPFKRVLEEEGVCALSKFDVLKLCSKGRLLRLAGRLVATAAAIPFPARHSWRMRARLCGLHSEALTWDEVSKVIPGLAALDTSTTWNSTLPHLLVLEASGWKTAIWSYSANSMPICPRGSKRYYNGKLRMVHEARRIYAWSPHIARWNRENLCDGPRNRVVPVGPVMCGDPTRCQRPPPDDGKLRISVFDVSLPAGRLRKMMGVLPLPPEFHRAFWDDIPRLLADIPEAILVLKPKRSPRTGLHEFPPSFERLLDAAERVEVIQHDDDPYEAVARSHVAISMPFTSPCLAAWHFGRVGIFYDPIRWVEHHPFEGFGRFFPRSYDELLAAVREAWALAQDGRRPQFPGDLSDFIGPKPGENPQSALLSDLSRWALGRAGDGTVAAAPVAIWTETAESLKVAP
ncbi:MAG: hypothetical protein JO317_01930 [Verrucomicrobiae bacterium]|nr:hypothetical protein [Verrucomicrobiae bacterium]